MLLLHEARCFQLPTRSKTTKRTNVKNACEIYCWGFFVRAKFDNCGLKGAAYLKETNYFKVSIFTVLFPNFRKCSVLQETTFPYVEKIFFSPKVSIQPCWPKYDSALPGAIWEQSGPKKPHQMAIPVHGRAQFSPGTKSALANWTVLALM